MAWPPTTHQDVQDAITTLMGGSGGVGQVTVSTGSEARPNAALVVWVGGTSRPTNMAAGDLWFTPAAPILSAPSGSTFSVYQVGSNWPARPTSRSDVTIIWIGTAPGPAVVASGTGGMLQNVDVFLQR